MVERRPNRRLKCSFKMVKTFDNDGNTQPLYVVLEDKIQEHGVRQRRIKIFYEEEKTTVLEPASILTPRTFEPADVCFGADDLRDRLFVADGTMPRVMVFGITPDFKGTDWECLQTIVPCTCSYCTCRSIPMSFMSLSHQGIAAIRIKDQALKLRTKSGLYFTCQILVSTDHNNIAT
jgi:hypothetical protein